MVDRCDPKELANKLDQSTDASGFQSASDALLSCVQQALRTDGKIGIADSPAAKKLIRRVNEEDNKGKGADIELSYRGSSGDNLQGFKPIEPKSLKK